MSGGAGSHMCPSSDPPEAQSPPGVEGRKEDESVEKSGPTKWELRTAGKRLLCCLKTVVEGKVALWILLYDGSH